MDEQKLPLCSTGLLSLQENLENASQLKSIFWDFGIDHLVFGILGDAVPKFELSLTFKNGIKYLSFHLAWLVGLSAWTE